MTSAPRAEILSMWDRLVDGTPGSDVAQLSAWASFREGYGYKPLYVLAFEGETVRGGAQVLHRRIGPIGDIGYVPHGPIIAAPDQNRSALLEVIGQALAELARHRFRMLFVQPPRGAHDTSHLLSTLGFRSSTADLAPPGSLLVDLEPDEDQLRRGLGKTARRMVGKWPELGVEVRVGDRHDLGQLARMLADTAEHMGFTALTEPYLQRLYRALAGRAVVFVGEVHGEPVAASLVTYCGTTVRSRLKGMYRSTDQSLRVPAAVQWEIIKWAKRNGNRWYDLGGLGEAPLCTLVDGVPGDEASWDGADRFKLHFGGTAFRYPAAVELIRPWPVRFAYNLSARFPAGRTLIRRVTERLRGGRGRPSRRP